MKRSLTLPLAFVALAAFTRPGVAQEKAQEKTGAVSPMKPPAGRRVFVDSKGILHCYGTGRDCYVFRLVNAKSLTPFHDAELEEYTNRINRILDELRANNKDATRDPRFIVTPYAPFLAWCRSEDTMDVSKGAITPDDNPSKFYQTLGIARALDWYRPKATRHWEWGPTQSVYCKPGGHTQVADRLINSASLSPAHDRVLEDYTNRINAILDEAGKRRNTAKLQLSLLVTPRGLFLAWSKDDDTAGPSLKGSITADSDEDTILRALGIEAGSTKGER